MEQLRSGGVLPTGPVSAWPESRNQELTQAALKNQVAKSGRRTSGNSAKKVKAAPSKMIGSLTKTAIQGLRNGKVSSEIREERYDTCKTCPAFIEDSKRCSECGCFMEAKTWVGGNPNTLCPLKKWAR